MLSEHCSRELPREEGEFSATRYLVVTEKAEPHAKLVIFAVPRAPRDYASVTTIVPIKTRTTRLSCGKPIYPGIFSHVSSDDQTRRIHMY